MIKAFLVSLLAILLLAACSSDPMLAAYLEANRAMLERPASAVARPARFVVEPGTSARAIAQKLQAEGLITDAHLFEAYVRVNGLAARLEAGTYVLSPDMTPVEIAEALQHSRAASITVTIPEGWRLEQIADYLGKTGVLDGEAYRRLVASGDLSALGDLESGPYDFLVSRPAGTSLEGYLFPDTYELPRDGATPADLLRRQLDNFADKVVPLYQRATAERDNTMGLYEVLTLASIVEREAAVDDERPAIAAVYLNRLAAGMKLEADPTVQYAMGYQKAIGQWWKTPVFLEEYSQVDSLYNTYLHAGLPPGPIASPGLRSIEAVLYPAQHGYLFLVAAPDNSGRHVFAHTFEEHQENVRRYRGQ